MLNRNKIIKKFKKSIDNRKPKWYNKQAVTKQQFFRKDEKKILKKSKKVLTERKHYDIISKLLHKSEPNLRTEKSF